MTELVDYVLPWRVYIAARGFQRSCGLHGGKGGSPASLSEALFAAAVSKSRRLAGPDVEKSRGRVAIGGQTARRVCSGRAADGRDCIRDARANGGAGSRAITAPGFGRLPHGQSRVVEAGF